MKPAQRVIETISHGKPDRIPISAWLTLNPGISAEIQRVFGSIENFEDQYEFDFITMINPVLNAITQKSKEDIIWPYRHAHQMEIEPAVVLDIPFSDPDDMAMYQDVRQWVAHHKQERGRFLAVRQPGVFEGFNGVFGIENHLVYLLMYESELKELYRRLANWIIAFAHHCFDLGVDMLLVSDDWGAQNALMFSPEVWRKLVYPAHELICRSIHQRGAYAGLHTDGNNTSVLPGIVELGYDVVHPFQESAGMDFNLFKAQYSRQFTVMGGLDVQTTLGFGRRDALKKDIERVVDMFRDGGLILSTSHAVQDHCTIEELTFAFDHIYKYIRK